MKRKFYFLIVFLVLTIVCLNAQNRVVISPADDLVAAVNGASAGDTIVLQEGIHVARYDEMVVKNSLTIIAETDVKPIVYGGQIDVQGTDIDIYIEGIDYSGATVDSSTGTEDLEILEGDYFLNLHDKFISGGDITVKNCIIRNLNRSVVRGDRSDYTVENFLFDNLIIHDLRGDGDYGPFRMKEKITFTTFTLTNSTFYNVLNKIIDNQDTPSHPMDFLIKNCTFYKWGGGKNAQYLFDIQDNDQARLIIQDCIFGKTNDDPLAEPPLTVNGWRYHADVYLEMITTAMAPDFVLTNGAYLDVDWDVSDYNLVDVDPDFANPEDGDFTLPEESDLLVSSQTGGIIGDPRWEPVSTVGIEELQDGIAFSIYPNPADRVFYLEFSNAWSGSEVIVYNIIGSRVKQFSNVHPDTPLNISDLGPGMYFIQVGSHQSDVAKLIIK